MRSAFRLFGLSLASAAAIGSLASAASPASGLEGRWTAEQTAADGSVPKTATISFTRALAGVSGTMREGMDDLTLFDIREMGTTVSFTVVVPGTPYVSIRYVGALTGDEILALFESDTAPADSLVAEFLLNADTGTSAVDTSPLANNGMIVDGVWSVQD